MKYKEIKQIVSNADFSPRNQSNFTKSFSNTAERGEKVL